MIPDKTLKPWVVVVGPPLPGAKVTPQGLAEIGHFVWGCQFDTEEEAKEKAKQLNHNERTWTFIVHDNRHHGCAPASASSKAVNDHICPTCKNDRCSKQEKTCWKCGSNL